MVIDLPQYDEELQDLLTDSKTRKPAFADLYERMKKETETLQKSDDSM